MSDIKFINMTSTEWWMLKEQIDAGKCKQESRWWSLDDFYKTKVVTPGGDTYVIRDWDGKISEVEKVDPEK